MNKRCYFVQDYIRKIPDDMIKETIKIKRKGEVFMQQVFVKFNSAEQVRSFVNVISTIEENFDMGSGRRLVDAKSLLGVFALDLTQPQKLRCNSDDTSVMEKITPFLYTDCVAQNEITL